MVVYDSTHTGSWHDNNLPVNEIVDLIYPIGSIYFSAAQVDPAILFGGSWEPIQDRFILTSGNNYTLGNTGGEATHTLTQAETPAHTHTRGTMNITGSFSQLGHTGGVSYGMNIRDSGQSGALYSFHSTRCYAYSGAQGEVSEGHSGFGFDASRNWTGSTSSVGGNGAHNNMPPYIVMNAWQRIA